MARVTYVANIGLKLVGVEDGAWMNYTGTSNTTNGESITDITGNGKTLTSVGVVNRNTKVSSGSDLSWYSGFSTSKYLNRASDSSFDFGTNECYIGVWIKVGSDANTLQYITERSSGGSNRIALFLQTGKITFTAGTTSITSNQSFIANTKYFIQAKRDLDGTKSITINGILDIKNTVSASTISGGVLRVGVRYNSSNPFLGSIALLRIGGGVNTSPTSALLHAIYDAEKPLFAEGSMYSEIGSSYSLDIRHSTLDRQPNFIDNRIMSLNGNTETITNRKDILWNISTIILLRTDGTLGKYRNFLDSTSDGQLFTFDPYGTILSPDFPLSAYLDSNGYSESREGNTEYFTIDFILREF